MFDAFPLGRGRMFFRVSLGYELPGPRTTVRYLNRSLFFSHCAIPFSDASPERNTAGAIPGPAEARPGIRDWLFVHDDRKSALAKLASINALSIHRDPRAPDHALAVRRGGERGHEDLVFWRPNGLCVRIAPVLHTSLHRLSGSRTCTGAAVLRQGSRGVVHQNSSP